MINYRVSFRDFSNLFSIITPLFKADKVVSGFETSTRAASSHIPQLALLKNLRLPSQLLLSSLGAIKKKKRQRRQLREALRPCSVLGCTVWRRRKQTSRILLAPRSRRGLLGMPAHRTAAHTKPLQLPTRGRSGRAAVGAALGPRGTAGARSTLPVSKHRALAHTAKTSAVGGLCVKVFSWFKCFRRQRPSEARRGGLEEGQAVRQHPGNPRSTTAAAGALLTHQLRCIRRRRQVLDWQKHPPPNGFLIVF